MHVRVACPPIMAPCSYGIDMSTIAELFAPKLVEEPIPDKIPADTLAKLAADLGADSLRYLGIEELARCIGLPEESLCMGCLTGKYPTEWGGRLYELAREDRDREVPEGVVEGGQRTHERVVSRVAGASRRSSS